MAVGPEDRQFVGGADAGGPGAGFVGDINLMRKTLCSDCLDELAQLCLPKEVGYGIKSTGRTYKFLNCWLAFGDKGLLVKPYNANWGFHQQKAAEGS